VGVSKCVITDSCKLKEKNIQYIIHAVGPIWKNVIYIMNIVIIIGKKWWNKWPWKLYLKYVIENTNII
jgi:hypothetical protein